MLRCGSPFHPLSHKGADFVEMPRAEIMCINADIHGKGSRCVREVPMRMSVQVPRSMMGAIPDPHGVVTNHDGLAVYGDFRISTRSGPGSVMSLSIQPTSMQRSTCSGRQKYSLIQRSPYYRVQQQALERRPVLDDFPAISVALLLVAPKCSQSVQPPLMDLPERWALFA
jgi:hypothetical protein